MSITQVHSETANAISPKADMKLEVVVIPVSDVDRAKRFYGGLGWRLDADFVVGDAFRGVQFTPPGSSCSIHFGTGITSAVPGSARGNYLVVSDVAAARAELVARGVDVSEVFHRLGPGKPPVKRPTIRSGTVIPRSPHSAIRTATNGCCRRSPRDSPAGSTRTTTTFTSSAELGERTSPCGGRAWRARKAHRWPARCKLA